MTVPTTRAELSVDFGPETAWVHNPDSPFDQKRHGLAATGAAVAYEMIYLMAVHGDMDKPLLLCHSQHIRSFLSSDLPSCASRQRIRRGIVYLYAPFQGPIAFVRGKPAGTVCDSKEFCILDNVTNAFKVKDVGLSY
jgi:hypothetical protein